MSLVRPLAQLLVAVMVALPWHTIAAAPVSEFMLDNGLKVLVKEDHRAPVAVSQLWYKVGSSYEHDGITGLSHMLEHMMFKGTERHGPGEFSRLLAAAGASDNAFTGRDYTAYYQHLGVDKLELALRLEADRMTNLLLDREEFLKERDVVAEERRLRTEDRPNSRVYEQFMAAAYLAGPYGQPVIGWMNDIENYTIEDLEAWYGRWYAPDNAVLVVAGDVEPAAVRALAEEHFGAIPAAGTPPPKPRQEPPQTGIRRIELSIPARLPYLVMGYKAPNIQTAGEEWEPYALTVLAAILDGGSSARLQRELVRGAEVAASASADYSLYQRLPGLFTLSGIPADDTPVAALEAALGEVVERLRQELVSAAELERVKTQVVAEDVFQRDSVFYQALRLGMLETIGLDWRLDEAFVAAIRAVTAEQVRTVARRYLGPDTLTVAVLDPQPMEAPVARPRAPGGNTRVH
ncbi:MAG: pitrilysin family protein [Gammaproteobacteria bacterium]|nr:pitrilysin family protein [Gammaproteobacteria bacterium]